MKKIVYLVLPLLSLLLLTGCVKNPIIGSWELTNWSVSSIAADYANITLIIEEKTLSGNGGVNSYSAPYKLSLGNKISIGDIQATEIAAEDPLLNQAESNYFSLLKSAHYYEIKNDQLILSDSKHNELLIFNKANTNSMIEKGFCQNKECVDTANFK